MRRILRKVAMEETENLGDVSTLDDPSVVKEIIDAHVQYKSQLSRKKWRKMQNFPREKEITYAQCYSCMCYQEYFIRKAAYLTNHTHIIAVQM